MGMYIDMYIGMCMDMSMDMFMDMCTKVCIRFRSSRSRPSPLRVKGAFSGS